MNEVEKKEIDEMASDIDYATVSKEISLEDRKEIAKALVILGYIKPAKQFRYWYDPMENCYKLNGVKFNEEQIMVLSGYSTFRFDDVKKQAIKEFAKELEKRLNQVRIELPEEWQRVLLDTIIKDTTKEYGGEEV